MDGVSFIDGKHSDEDVLQVSLVCPDVSVDDIRTDLLITNSAELTVNRILDGTFYRSDFVSAQDNGVDRSTGTAGGGQRSPSEADCSTTDVNSDSDTDSPCKSSDVPAVDKNTGCSGTDVNSDDDLVILSSKVTAKTLPPPLQSCTSSAMYGSHCMSDDSGVSDNDLPNTAHSNPASVCSDDELTSKERQPLSELLGLNSVKGCNSSNVRAPTNYLPLALDDEAELPDLEAYTDSFHTDSVDIATTDWSQNTADTALSSQTSTISASSASSGAYNSKKKRRTPEEIAESKKLALERKAQKERDKKEREERKKREVHARKAVQEAKKQTRPGDCMKYITVVVDLGLINAGSGAAVLAAFDGEPVKCVAETQPVPNTISWRRLVVDHRVAEDASLQTVETEQLESEVLLIFSTTDFLQLADNTKQFQSGCVSEDLTLTAHTQRVQQVYGGRNVTVIALGMEQYFRERKTDLQRKHRNAVRGDGAEQPSKKRSKTQASAAPILSRLEIEEVLVGLQLQTGCNCQLVETSKDLVELVKTFTKAVAEAPSKKGRLESAFSFHCEGGGVGKVDKGGAGLLKVWKQQLQQFKTISAEMANAIIAAYPSPRMLVEAYKRCSNEREAERLLEDIVVRRGAGALTTNRRIGKELSRRVFQLFTVTDPDFVLT